MNSLAGSRELGARLPAGLGDVVRAAALTAVVTASALLVLAIVALTGGSPNALNQLGVIPILLGAYFFGWRGAMAVAVLVALLMGPVAVALGVAGGSADAFPWVRPAVQLVIGATVGVLVQRLHDTRAEAVNTTRHAMVAFARGAEAKDASTGEHVGRCRDLSATLAQEAGLGRQEAEDIAYAALLHDVGKLHVPDAILLKPGRLTSEEWEVMQRHTVWGAEILRDGNGFETARRIARWHHERFDGHGYPDGLAGEQIPFEARIVAVVDAFDAMTHDRPYQRARTIADALEELRAGAGRQFDPELARLFIHIVDRETPRS